MTNISPYILFLCLFINICCNSYAGNVIAGADRSGLLLLGDGNKVKIQGLYVPDEISAEYVNYVNDFFLNHRVNVVGGYDEKNLYNSWVAGDIEDDEGSLYDKFLKNGLAVKYDLSDSYIKSGHC